ncbi:hypothetical protein EXIGLDRAFT_780760 [Exidia glandulosa HHB12029]|uniref:Uncharacterized protein n=1 Tax=Exidia glandulosa HHB12029 TaxID=1314781 RepID=A0A165BGB6_EXIGL|nr:hypothetical protein EXIGLDRAFT_780760 [Exidia glandulosa HHB12029]
MSSDDEGDKRSKKKRKGGVPGPKSVLPKAFEEWAKPRLRAATDAKKRDQAGGVGGANSEFNKLLHYYMQELESENFGQLDYPGRPEVNSKGQKVDEKKLREMHMDWFRNKMKPSGTRVLKEFEKGGTSLENPLRATSAQEMWAAVEENRKVLNARVWEQLEADGHERKKGVHPPQYIGARKRILKQMFEELSESSRKEWEDVAVKTAAEEATSLSNAGAVERRQAGFMAELDEWLAKKMPGMGDVFAISVMVGYVGQQNRQAVMKSWSGDSDPLVPRFSRTTHWQKCEDGSQAWVNERTKGRVLPRLEYLEGSYTEVEELMVRRKALKLYLERMWDLAVGEAVLAQSDTAREDFWKQVKTNPDDFVHRSRLPHGTTFHDPTLMVRGNFYSLYNHVRNSLAANTEVEFENRWEYLQEAILRQRAVLRARRADAERSAVSYMCSCDWKLTVDAQV